MSNQLRRILLAEDDIKDVELTLIALEEANLANSIDVARDGQEALDYLYRQGRFESRNAGNPVVVLLDLKMPRLDGLQVLERMKKDSYLKMIPVVVLTSSREESDLIRSYDLGANAYVVKPVDYEQFLESIKEVGLFWAIVNESPPKPHI